MNTNVGLGKLAFRPYRRNQRVLIRCQTLNNLASVITPNNTIKILANHALIISSIDSGLGALTKVAACRIISTEIALFEE